MGIFTNKSDLVDGVRIRVSDRARRIHLRVAPDQAIELVLPRGAKRALALQFLADSADWVDQARRGIAHKTAAERQTCGQMPVQLFLPIVDEMWRIEHASSVRTRLQQDEASMTISIGAGNLSDARNALRRWLKRQAAVILPPLLEKQAERTGFHYHKVRIGLQKTRWGSCSARGTISLNASLILLEPGLVQYLMVHELCHVQQLNHSRKFWELVGSFEPGYQQRDRTLRSARKLLPGWLYCDDRK